MTVIRWVAIISALIVQVLVGVSAAFAQPALSTIQDTLYKADGSRFEGSASIEWRTFEAAGGYAIPQQSIVVPIRAGVLRVQLVPTTTAASGTFYQVKFNSEGRVQFTEYWSVPDSATILKLNQIRVARPAGSGSTETGNNPIPLAMVTGLTDALAQRPVKDASYANQRVVKVSATGLLTSVIGNASDCIRVDGSTVSCSGSGEGGSGVSGPTFVDAEIPTGTANGVNATFQLSQAPNPASSLMLFRNGLLQKVNSDFQLSGTTITFLSGSIPQSGDAILAFFRN